MYPRILWELVSDPLVFADHTLGTTDLGGCEEDEADTGRVRWRAVVNTAMNSRFLEEATNFSIR